MVAHVVSAALVGVEAVPVRVEVDIARGLPSTTVVGLPDAAVRESRERVRVALRNSDLPFPAGRVLVSLSPGGLRKEGPAFDLPIALALLQAQGALPPDTLRHFLPCGELALDGSLRPVRGAVALATFALGAGRRMLVPPANAPEVAVLEGAEPWAPRTLLEAVRLLRGRQAPPPVRAPDPPPPDTRPDLLDVRGQPGARKALEISAAGRHHLLLTGPPGTGKTLLAHRLPSLLPPLSRAEALEVLRIHSSAGLAGGRGLPSAPPFRAPHHTSSSAALTGGGATPRPGEISLAHRGLLYLDELPEFPRRSLEALRQPLEEGVVRLHRARSATRFPASFQLVASRNPCPCGHAGDTNVACRCSPSTAEAYERRVGGPLLDRLDLRVNVSPVEPDQLLRLPSGEASATVAARVSAARECALARQGVPNAELGDATLARVAHLTPDVRRHATSLAAGLRLSARGVVRLRRVARTVADLAGSDAVASEHLDEAASFRGASEDVAGG